MKIDEAKRIMKTETTKERETALYTLYNVKTQKDVLEQFKTKVTALKVVPYENKRMGKAKVQLKVNAQYQEQYIKLLELVLEYSHAIFFLYSNGRINKNIKAYEKIARLSIKAENVEKAFDNFKRIYSYREPQKESQEESQEEVKVIDSSCLALEHIRKLKELINTDIIVKRETIEDKKAYMKFAIVSLAVGITAKDILDVKYSISPKKTILDYEYVNSLVSELRAYQKERIKPLSERGIRNGVDNLKLPMSESLYYHANKKYSHCRNFNHLIYLNKECLTSSTQKN